MNKKDNPKPTAKQIEAYKLVKLNGLSQEAAAARIGISQAAIGQRLKKLMGGRPDIWGLDNDRLTDDKISEDGCVYFVQEGEGGAIKIGYAKNPIARLKELQVANPDKLNMLGVIRVDSGNLEYLIHKKFAHLKIRGEWFRPEKELLEYIKTEAISNYG